MFLSDISLRSKAYIFFASLFLVSSFNFGMMIYLESESKKDFKWVDHTHEVIELSVTLLVYLVDAETGQRGYLLTSKPDYLEPHYAGVAKSRKVLEQLKIKTSDNPEQQVRLSRIEGLVDKKFSELKHTIDLHKVGKEDEALTIVKSDIGKNFMDDIRLEIEAFNLEEERLLYKRHKVFSTLQDNIRIIFIVEFFLFIFVLLFLGWAVSRTVITPVRKLHKSAQAFHKEGEFASVDINSKDEIGLLASAFNAMGEKVISLLEELDKTAKQAAKERDIALEQAISDPLTGLSNRRFMEVQLDKLMVSSQRYKHDLSVIMFDIDHFKQVNDTYGHLVGDVVLQKIGQLIKSESRGGDLSIRYGGEEFMLVLTHTSIKGAEKKAETLKSHLSTMEIPELRGNYITISMGVTQLKTDDSSVSQLIHRADQALYTAKNGGRDSIKTL